MTEQTPNPALGVIARALPVDHDDGTTLVEVAQTPNGPRHIWGRPERVAERLLSALTAAGYQVLPPGGETIWQYALPTLDGTPVPLIGTPRIVTPNMVRRPLAPTGPWQPDTEETP